MKKQTKTFFENIYRLNKKSSKSVEGDETYIHISDFDTSTKNPVKDSYLYSFRKLEKTLSVDIDKSYTEIFNSISSTIYKSESISKSFTLENQSTFEEGDRQYITIKDIDYNYYSRLIVNKSQDDIFAIGEISSTERIYLEMVKKHSISAVFRFCSILISKKYSDVQTMISIANFLSTLSYPEARNEGVDTLLASLLPHISDSVVEFVVRIFENWHEKESLEILKNVKVQSTWLDSYIQDVIRSIESDNLCIS